MARTHALIDRRRGRAIDVIRLGLCALLMLSGCVLPGGGAALDAWVAPDTFDLTPDAAPDQENPIFSAAARRVRLTGAANETIALQVGIRSASLGVPQQVSLSDLVGDAGRITASDAVRLYRVDYTTIDQFPSWYSDHAQRPPLARRFADALVPWDAPRGPSKAGVVWIDIAIPPQAAAGQYRGTLEVGGGIGAPLRFDVTLTVWPFALPSQPSLPIVCRIDPRDLLAEQVRFPDLPSEQTRLIPSDPSQAAAIRVLDNTMRMMAAHRMTPVLWGSFPRYRVVGPDEVEIDWTEYDALVRRWLDGAEGQPPIAGRWLTPLGVEYPSAQQNGGVASAAYARLFAAYARAVSEHFDERGWSPRSLIRPLPPGALTADAVDASRRISALIHDVGVSMPFVAHLPARSLRGLGWHNAPDVQGVEAGIWAPPAGWLEPSAIAQQRALGHAGWLMPDHPPFAPALAPYSPAVDAALIAWIAARYQLGGVWIEHAAEFARRGGLEPAGSLLAPGTLYGLRDTPVPTVRLKRLRRGQQDFELLRMLDQSGKSLLARRTIEQVVRYACLEACDRSLLSVRDTGWTRDPATLALARVLVAREIAGAAADADAGERLAQLADWERLMNSATQVQIVIRGVRLTSREGRLRASALATVDDRSDEPVNGGWSLADSADWSIVGAPTTRVASNTRQRVQLDLATERLLFDDAGFVPLKFALSSQTSGETFSATGRLAVTTCPLVTQGPTIDGALDEWPRTATNTAGDFQLVRGRANEDGPSQSRPTAATTAYFCMDRESLYVGVRCELSGAAPLWKADNVIPVDGAIPWGQEVVELLINPRNTPEGNPAEIYCLQVKPSGVVVARRGPRTDPPIAASVDWPARARVAARVGRDAWIVELAIPIESLGKDASRGGIWGVNVTRLDARRGEYSSWSGARGLAYENESLGNLIVARP
ncbi:MAG: hypothetical protein U1D55_14470 [Phycisphaerae bacterium]